MFHAVLRGTLPLPAFRSKLPHLIPPPRPRHQRFGRFVVYISPHGPGKGLFGVGTNPSNIAQIGILIPILKRPSPKMSFTSY